MQRNAGLDRDGGNAQGVSKTRKHLRARQATELCLGWKRSLGLSMAAGAQRGFGDILGVSSSLLPPTQT